MSNVISLKSAGGFTRMENDLYEALIAADLSGRELRVALAIHRLTAGYNQEAVKVAALYISKMMYQDEAKAVAERANVSRTINSLIRQRVLSSLQNFCRMLPPTRSPPTSTAKWPAARMPPR
ncbi:replication protein [Pseudomonas vlassakiae]|uniref:replication protein n=1 Tax=Pseudomonas vlassakiae TaxID=485888 RepID=UPI003D2A9F12